MTFANGHQDPAFGSYKNPQAVFNAAIKKGVLSTNEATENFVGNFMYMGEAENGGSMFKNIVTRFYLPACKLEVA